MNENQVSLTAIITAYIRAHHARFGVPKIFNDDLAEQIVPTERRDLIEQGLNQSTQNNNPAAWVPMLQVMGAPNVLSRARYTEDNLARAVERGVQQYVILGAGLDTFGWRRPDLLEKIQAFEVDHPATQAFKLSRIAELGWDKPANLHFVPVDFTQENLAAALRHSAYDERKLSFFSWLGVTMYLTQVEVFATLRSLAEIAPRGSIVVFDYFEAKSLSPAETNSLEREIRAELQKIGEPMKTGFDPAALAKELAGAGFNLRENLSPADIQARFFASRTDGYHASADARLALAVVE